MIDDPSKYPACPHADSLPFLPLPDDRDWLTDMRISSANLSQRVATAKFQTDDYNFMTPSTELKATAGNGSWQVYEYPGRYTAKSDGDTVAKRRMEEIEALVKQLSGTSPLRHMTAGATFTMTKHPSDAFNGKYALYSVRQAPAPANTATASARFPPRCRSVPRAGQPGRGSPARRRRSSSAPRARRFGRTNTGG